MERIIMTIDDKADQARIAGVHQPGEKYHPDNCPCDECDKARRETDDYKLAEAKKAAGL